ncbi:MAG: thioredoxin family protein [Victivallaceae bacterium]|nr:thioredoxin family protein [Victivallaceae bacterium]
MKKLLTLIVCAAGLFLAAAPTVLDGSSDEALTRSFVNLWASLDDNACDKFGCAAIAASEKLGTMDAAEREKLLDGKNAEEFMKIAQQLSPEKYEEGIMPHARFDDASRAATTKAIRKALAGINPEEGFFRMLIMANYIFVNSEGGPIMRLILDELQHSSDEQVAEYVAMRTVRKQSKSQQLRDQLFHIFLCYGTRAAAEKARELAPAAFEAALKDIKSNYPDGDLADFAEGIRNRQAELVSKFATWLTIYNLDWFTDFEAAQRQAAAEGKPMFVLFTQSDLMPPNKLESELLATTEFADFAADRLVLVYVDFPEQEALLAAEQTAANKSMAEKYGISHDDLPAVLLMDKQGNVTGKAGYRKISPDRYIEQIEKTLDKK